MSTICIEHRRENIDDTSLKPDDGSSTHCNAMLAAALEHARRGWAVFPLAPRTKLPIKGSNGYLDATSDQATIRSMWSLYPDANIAGAPCMSRRLIMDVDPRRHGSKRLQQLVDEFGPGFLSTPTTLTPSGGQHLCYLAPEPLLPTSFTVFGKGIDIISSWGYVVLPPSRLRRGELYVYEDGYSPDECLEGQVPEWLAAALLSEQHVRRIRLDARVRSILPTVRKADISNILTEMGGLRGEWLSAVAGDAEFAVDACRLMGIPLKRFGATFCCVLPGHKEQHPSASIIKNSHGCYVYHDFHTRCERTWYTLAEVRRALAMGQVQTVHASKSEIALWQLRLMVETGYVPPASVNMLPLPEGASVWARKAYDGFRLLLGCKWLYESGEPTAFARRFVASWCGISEWHAGTGINELIAAGIIKPVGIGLETRLFLPGDIGTAATTCAEGPSLPVTP